MLQHAHVSLSGTDPASVLRTPPFPPQHPDLLGFVRPNRVQWVAANPNKIFSLRSFRVPCGVSGARGLRRHEAAGGDRRAALGRFPGPSQSSPRANGRNRPEADGRRNRFNVASRREADIGSLRSAGAFSVSPRNADKSRRCSSCPGWRRKNRTAAPFCLDENQPLRAAAHVFAVAEIPPPMIAQVEGGIFTSTSIPFGAMQQDRNQA